MVPNKFRLEDVVGEEREAAADGVPFDLRGRIRELLFDNLAAFTMEEAVRKFPELEDDAEGETRP